MIHLFCLSDRLPTVGELLNWLTTRQAHLSVDDQQKERLDASDWRSVSLFFDPDARPIILHADQANQDSQARATLEDFLQRVGPPGRSRSKNEIVSHLRETRLLVSCELPVEEMDDAAWDANGQILTFFVEEMHALIHAEGEGFYWRSELILKMP